MPVFIQKSFWTDSKLKPKLIKLTILESQYINKPVSSANNQEDGSLRENIENINQAETPFNSKKITFSLPANSTIRFDSPLPTLKADQYEIDGGNNNITLQGPHSSSELFNQPVGNLKLTDLQLTNANIEVAKEKTLTMQYNSGHTVYPDIVNGEGGFTKSGLGILELTTPQGYEGQTNIKQGTLKLSGADLNKKSTITIYPNASLVGSGKIGPVINHGTIQPETSTSTFEINGDYFQSKDAKYKVAIDPAGKSSKIESEQAEFQGGTIVVVPELGDYKVGTDYIIFESLQKIALKSPVTLESSINMDLAFQPNLIKLTVLEPKSANKQAKWTRLAKGGNPLHVAEYLTSLGPAIASQGDLGQVMAQLGQLPDSEVRSALNQLHGAFIMDLAHINHNNSALMHHNLTWHLNQNRTPPISVPHTSVTPAFSTALAFRSNSEELIFNPNLNVTGTGLASDWGPAAHDSYRATNGQGSLWAKGFGLWSHLGSSANTTGFTTKTGGFTVGGDYAVATDWSLGISGGYANTDIDWRQNRADGRIHSYYVGPYICYLGKSFYIDGAILGGYHRYKTTRHIRLSTLQRDAHGKHNGWEVTAHLGTGLLNVEVEKTAIQPFINLYYTNLHQKAFQETGADSLNLKLDSKTHSTFRGELGMRLHHTFSTETTTWTPYAGASWVHKNPLSKASIVNGLAAVKTPFTVNGYNKTQNLFAPSVGLSFVHNNQFSVNAQYSAEVGDKFDAHEVYVQLKYLLS